MKSRVLFILSLFCFFGAGQFIGKGDAFWTCFFLIIGMGVSAAWTDYQYEKRNA